MPPQTYIHRNRAGKLLRSYREHYPPLGQKYSRSQFVQLIQGKYAHAVAKNLQGVAWTENQLRAKEDGQPPLVTEDFRGLVESGVIDANSQIFRDMVQAAIEDWAEIRAYKKQHHELAEDDPKLLELRQEITKELPSPPEPQVVEKIVEVIKEVPVEVVKEVEKIVEVPFEVVKEVVVEKEVPVEKVVYREKPLQQEVVRPRPVPATTPTLPQKSGGGAGLMIGLVVIGIVVAVVIMIASSGNHGGSVSSEPFCRLAPNEGPSKLNYRKGEMVTIDFMGRKQTLLCVDPTDGRNGFQVINEVLYTPAP